MQRDFVYTLGRALGVLITVVATVPNLPDIFVGVQIHETRADCRPGPSLVSRAVIPNARRGAVSRAGMILFVELIGLRYLKIATQIEIRDVACYLE